jgi:hypothetical protein
VPEEVVRALTTRWDMWREPELPAELAALITDEILDQFTVAGDARECADRLRAMASALPEVTGFRVKLPRPIRNATYADYEHAIVGMGEVIASLQSSDPQPARAAAMTP